MGKFDSILRIERLDACACPGARAVKLTNYLPSTIAQQGCHYLVVDFPKGEIGKGGRFRKDGMDPWIIFFPSRKIF